MTKAYEIGTRIHYTGDQANIPGNGTITATHERTAYTPMGYTIQMDDGREWKHVLHISFNPGIGRRFMTLDEYQAERAAQWEKLQAYMKSKGYAVTA